MLSNFEKGFELFVNTESDKGITKRTRTIRLHKAICLMATEDFELMEKIVCNKWMINNALSSSFADRYQL